MPYKLASDGKTVLVKRNSGWEILKRHDTKKKALAHIRALSINVGHKK